MATIYDLPRDVLYLIVEWIDDDLLLPLLFIKLFRPFVLVLQKKHDEEYREQTYNDIDDVTGEKYSEYMKTSANMALTFLADACSRFGYFSLLKWCCESLKCVLCDQVDEAAAGGHLDILKWLCLEKGCDMQIWVCVFAAEQGHLEVLKWAYDNGCEIVSEVYEVYNAAARCGHLNVLKWLLEEANPICQPTEQTTMYAADNGHLEVLKYLHEGSSGSRSHEEERFSPCPWNDNVCASLARGGHLEALKWARDSGAPWASSACNNAAREGHLEVLKWIMTQEDHPPWFPGNCSMIARQGRLEVLKWIRENLVHPYGQRAWTWNETTCSSAAAGGHLELLKWLREGANCPWNEKVFELAAKHNQLEVIKWAYENGCPRTGRKAAYICDVAARHGHVNVLAWARDNGFSWFYSTSRIASKFGRLDVLKYMREGRYNDRCPWNLRTVRKYAITNGHTKIINWLDEMPRTACQKDHLGFKLFARVVREETNDDGRISYSLSVEGYPISTGAWWPGHEDTEELVKAKVVAEFMEDLEADEIDELCLNPIDPLTPTSS